MTTPEKKPNFADQLARQIPPVDAEQFAEYRRSLDEELVKCDRRERRMRIVLLALAGFVGALFVSTIVMRMVAPGRDPLEALNALPAGAAAVALAIVVGCAVSLVPLAVIYKFHYQRQLRSNERKHLLAILGQLRREVQELRERIDRDQ